MTRIFLHGLESSSKGAKALFFRALFPDMLIPDFQGNLSVRMASLVDILADRENIVMVGSSFGGLMATLYTIQLNYLVRSYLCTEIVAGITVIAILGVVLYSRIQHKVEKSAADRCRLTATTKNTGRRSEDQRPAWGKLFLLLRSIYFSDIS